MRRENISSGMPWESIVGYSRAVKVGRAHGEYFHDIRPAATMVEVKRLLVPEMLVEIEADAVSTER